MAEEPGQPSSLTAIFLSHANQVLTAPSCHCGIWFSESNRKRKSLVDLWEAHRSSVTKDAEPNNTRTTKRTLCDDDDSRLPPQKRQRLLDDEALEYKYVSLADSEADYHQEPEEKDTQRFTFGDALRYMNQVKLACRDRLDTYHGFLDIMEDFGRGRLDHSGVVIKVAKLFFTGLPNKEAEMVVTEFCTFLPPGYEVSCNPITVTAPEATFIGTVSSAGSLMLISSEGASVGDGLDAADEQD